MAKCSSIEVIGEISEKVGLDQIEEGHIEY